MRLQFSLAIILHACWRVNFTKGFQGSRLGFEFKREPYPLGVELSGLRMRERQVPPKIIFGHVGEGSFSVAASYVKQSRYVRNMGHTVKN